ncbi:BnaC01g31460D [Brassica napus]|uniref:BnaC01g31460D protein n=2 Tax=Brassica TaxID=3705 RepID=A0A078IE23_BRANA|nr:BnaC01g31460D [Brassica napus]
MYDLLLNTLYYSSRQCLYSYKRFEVRPTFFHLGGEILVMPSSSTTSFFLRTLTYSQEHGLVADNNKKISEAT